MTRSSAGRSRDGTHAQRGREGEGRKEVSGVTFHLREGEEIREATAGLYYPTLTSDGDFGFSVVKLPMPMDG